MKNNFYLIFFKPVFDFICAFIGTVILFPIMIVVAILIKITSKGPVFFKQERVGKNFKLFKIIKFRTMVVNADKLGEAVTTAKDNRITKTGKFLRKFKLDELPQLFNVLKGEMSLVGPRPEVLKYVEQFKGDYNHILKVKPGITDYAALKYRNEEEILAKYDNVEQGYVFEVLPEKIKLYKQYIEEVSFIVDVKIILNTLVRVIK